MTAPAQQFVCGFFGARDNYEIPFALEEAGLLEVVLTDFYGSNGLLTKWRLIRAKREHDGLPASKVHGSWVLTVARMICGKVFADPERQNLWTDRILSKRIACEAKRRRAHIFTYEPYAVPRPHGGFPGGRRQVVFYYHPHVDTEDAIYREDEARWPEFYGDAAVTNSPWRRRTADAWRQADLVLCASSFTKQSLVAAGMEEGRIVVVPYGVGERHEAIGMRQEAEGEEHTAGGQRQVPLRLLFVGRNPLRKGLHHLLMAWNAANKRPRNVLTIVCAAKPPEMQRLVEGRDDVRWLDSLSGEELARSYRDADALVVPSLCEGFGHVYLEAMGRGCAVVGTRNSALPDIGDEKQGVFTVGVGDVDGLAHLISNASSDPSMFRDVTAVAKRRAGEFTWERFRQGIVEAVRTIAS